MLDAGDQAGWDEQTELREEQECSVDQHEVVCALSRRAVH